YPPMNRTEYDFIPKDFEAIKTFVQIIEKRLTNLWMEYTEFTNKIRVLSPSSLIYPILFGEIDFYEEVLAAIRASLPEHLLKELEYESLLSNW
ncbi:MAG: hypothetical protein ACW97P_12260, partial [Candidatus Hodarchaeales archaeon]